jgi:uncharacterized lipoprotein NlpE involved in copper resistance
MKKAIYLLLALVLALSLFGCNLGTTPRYGRVVNVTPYAGNRYTDGAARNGATRRNRANYATYGDTGNSRGTTRSYVNPADAPIYTDTARVAPGGTRAGVPLPRRSAPGIGSANNAYASGRNNLITAVS